MKQLAGLDYFVLFAYLAIIFGMGVYFWRRQKSTCDYFIANRRIPGWAMGLAVLSTLVSNITFLANPGVAFAGDWRQFTNSFMAILVIFPIALVVIPFYRNAIGMSLYEYFEKRFGYGIRAYGAVAFILYYLSRMAFIFYVLSLAVEVMTGWNIHMIIILLGVMTVIYTLIGGIEAVIWTDVVQAILLVSGGIICLVIALSSAVGGAEAVIDAAWQAKKFSLGEWRFSLRGDTILVMCLFGLFQHAHNFGTDQTLVQRYLTAKTTREAVRNALISGIACVPVWCLFFFVGTAIWGYYQLGGEQLPAEALAKSDRIFPYFIMTQLPAGITGLVLAGLLSSAMSTLDGGLNSVSTVFVSDIYRKLAPERSDHHQLNVGRIVVVLTGIVSLGAAIWLTKTEEHALEMYYKGFSIFAGGILGLFLLAALNKRANLKGATIGIICCVIFIAWSTLTKWKIVDLGRWNYDLHPYMIGVFGHMIVIVVGSIASFLFPSSEIKKA